MTTIAYVSTTSDEQLTTLRARAAKDWAGRQRRDRTLRVALGVGVPVVLLALWQVASSAGVIDSRFFPSPSTIAGRAATDIADNGLLTELGHQFGVSLVRMAAGYFIGALAGVLLGTLMGSMRWVRYAFDPLLYAVYPMPKLAILPLLLIVFGIGNLSKITLVALGVFFVVCISTLSGTLYTNPMFQDVASAFSFPRLMRYRHVTVPAALPSIMNGLKLGIGQALILAVSVEFVSSNDGIGYFIWQSWQTFNIPSMFIGLFCVAAAGALAVFGGDAVERRLIPWAKH